MDQTLAFFADLPDLTAATFPDGAPEDIPNDVKPPTSRIQLAKVGKFKHPRYGPFAVTADVFANFVTKFEAGIPLIASELPVDFDHEPDLGGSTRACGWIKALHPEGDKLFATVEWNWHGAYAIREREFRYISPTWSMQYTDDQGVKHGPVLLACALTNRPFFEQMAVVTCSRDFGDDTLDFARPDDTPEPDPKPDPVPPTDPAPEKDDASDSRRAMELKDFAEIFSLPAEATDEQVRKAARTVVDKAADTSTVDTIRDVFGLDRDASDEDVIKAARERDERASKVPKATFNVVLENGDIVMDAAEVERFNQRAEDGDRAVDELAEVRFSVAWDNCLRAGKVTPTQRESFHNLYAKDAAGTLNTLSSLPRVVNTTRTSESGHVTAAIGDRAVTSEFSGPVDQAQLDLLKRARTLARERNLDVDEVYMQLAEGVAI